PYQREFMFDKSPIRLDVKARQIGLSHAIAGACAKDARTQHNTNVILSASKALSTEVLDKAKAHLSVLQQLGVRRARHLYNTSRIKLPNGGRIIARPSNPRTAR